MRGGRIDSIASPEMGAALSAEDPGDQSRLRATEHSTHFEEGCEADALRLAGLYPCLRGRISVNHSPLPRLLRLVDSA